MMFGAVTGAGGCVTAGFGGSGRSPEARNFSETVRVCGVATPGNGPVAIDDGSERIELPSCEDICGARGPEIRFSPSLASDGLETVITGLETASVGFAAVGTGVPPGVTRGSGADFARAIAKFVCDASLLGASATGASGVGFGSVGKMISFDCVIDEAGAGSGDGAVTGAALGAGSVFNIGVGSFAREIAGRGAVIAGARIFSELRVASGGAPLSFSGSLEVRARICARNPPIFRVAPGGGSGAMIVEVFANPCGLSGGIIEVRVLLAGFSGGTLDVRVVIGFSGGMMEVFAVAGRSGGMMEVFAVAGRSGGIMEVFAVTGRSGGMMEVFAVAGCSGGMMEVFDKDGMLEVFDTVSRPGGMINVLAGVGWLIPGLSSPIVITRVRRIEVRGPVAARLPRLIRPSRLGADRGGAVGGCTPGERCAPMSVVGSGVAFVSGSGSLTVGNSSAGDISSAPGIGPGVGIDANRDIGTDTVVSSGTESKTSGTGPESVCAAAASLADGSGATSGAGSEGAVTSVGVSAASSSAAASGSASASTAVGARSITSRSGVHSSLAPLRAGSSSVISPSPMHCWIFSRV